MKVDKWVKWVMIGFVIVVIFFILTTCFLIWNKNDSKSALIKELKTDGFVVYEVNERVYLVEVVVEMKYDAMIKIPAIFYHYNLAVLSKKERK